MRGLIHSPRQTCLASDNFRHFSSWRWYTLAKRKVGNRFILLHFALFIAIEIILITIIKNICDTWETFQQRSLPPPWERKNPRINRRVSVCPLWNMHKPLPQNVGRSATIPTCFWRIQLSSLESMFLLNLLRSIVTTSQTPWTWTSIVEV